MMTILYCGHLARVGVPHNNGKSCKWDWHSNYRKIIYIRNGQDTHSIKLLKLSRIYAMPIILA